VLIGYLRVCPSDDADRAALRRALAQAGWEQIVEEQPDLDGSVQQPELHGLLARLHTGDVGNRGRSPGNQAGVAA